MIRCTAHLPVSHQGVETLEPRHISVLDGVHRAIREYPERIALRTGDQTVSYRRFGELVHDLATRIAGRTVPGEFVGVDGRRGAGSIIAIVAALSARRPFVVLDSRDSDVSNSDKVRLLGVRLVTSAGSGGVTVDLTDVRAQWRPPAPDSLPPEVLAFAEGEICYAIQTSGSTGRPKCVLVRSAPLAAVVNDHVQRLAVGPGSTTLQFARLTFDGCITEIFWTLTAGASLVVLEETHLAPGAILAATLESFRVTHLKTTPFALSVTDPTSGMRLEHVVNGGGACRQSVVQKWSAVASFHNAYGLTETTVCNLLTGTLDPADCQESVPLGEPVGDCGYYLRSLDEHGVASGQASGLTTVSRGELVITGDSVAAGYLTEHGMRPFGWEGETGVYRTGDLVELRDGHLHFVERLDRQLKVRGYRLDPGEVEAAVCRLPAVRDAVVLAESLDSARPTDLDTLVCFYQGEVEPRAVRRHLESVLDPYKIPSVFRKVDAFLYTPNGKVDRQALQDTESASHRPAEARPRTARTGPQLLRVVRTLTEVDDVDLDDNFFDIGGNSASALLLVEQLRELGWIGVGLRDVLRAKTLRVLVGQSPEGRG